MTPPADTAHTAPQNPTADGVMESYLTCVSSMLPGPNRARGSIIAELRAGLLDAADAQRRGGLAPLAAAQAAVTEFGQPRQIAAAFGPELAARKARRVALALLATGPVIGLLWAIAAISSHLGIREAPPWEWAGAPPAAPIAFPLFGLVLVITVWTTLITLASTGRLSRWLPYHPRFAPIAAGVAGFGAVTADLLLLALLASQLATAPGKLSAGPVTLAAAASVARLVLARRSASQCLAQRLSLPSRAAL
jgi:hypothetical protein